MKESRDEYMCYIEIVTTVVLANSKDVEMGRGSVSTAQMEEKPMAMPLRTKKKVRGGPPVGLYLVYIRVHILCTL